MAAIVVDPRPQYRLNSGAVCAGGTLYFYEANSTVPQDVYSDPDLAPGNSLGASVELDSAGRTPTNIYYADADYNVELRDADDVQVFLAENTNQQVAAGASIPDPSTGDDDDVISVSGGAYVLRPISEVPDNTGQTGKYLGNDGEINQWTAFPAAADTPSVSVSSGASGYYWSEGILFQWGSETCTATGSLSVTKTVTFGQAFDSEPFFVAPIPVLSSGVTSNSPSGFPTPRFSSESTIGFTAGFFVGEENTGGTDTINASIPFRWFAVGPCATDPGA